MAHTARVKNYGKQDSGRFEVAVESPDQVLAEKIVDILREEYKWDNDFSYYIEEIDYNGKGKLGWYLPFYVFDMDYVNEFKRDFQHAKAKAILSMDK